MNAVTKAIQMVGGQIPMAKALGLSKQAVNHWATGFRQPSPEQCVQIERITRGRVKRAALRPDIFGPIRSIQQPSVEQQVDETARAA